ncbi:MAG TPA: hypothetical protein VL092_07225 [Chitinophagaceae bacterium]|nr:hypothetical protein [Chitinophagaceae bacterium]
MSYQVSVSVDKGSKVSVDIGFGSNGVANRFRSPGNHLWCIRDHLLPKPTTCEEVLGAAF